MNDLLFFIGLSWVGLGVYLIAVIPWSSPVLSKGVTNIPGTHINSLVSSMGICSKCKILSPDVEPRECDDLLCERCNNIRLVTLAKERQQRQLRSHRTPAIVKDGITAQNPGSDGDSSTSGDKLGASLSQPGGTAPVTASDTGSDGEDGCPSSISDDDPGTSGDASDDLTSGGVRVDEMGVMKSPNRLIENRRTDRTRNQKIKSRPTAITVSMAVRSTVSRTGSDAACVPAGIIWNAWS